MKCQSYRFLRGSDFFLLRIEAISRIRGSHSLQPAMNIYTATLMELIKTRYPTGIDQDRFKFWFQVIAQRQLYWILNVSMPSCFNRVMSYLAINQSWILRWPGLCRGTAVQWSGLGLVVDMILEGLVWHYFCLAKFLRDHFWIDLMSVFTGNVPSHCVIACEWAMAKGTWYADTLVALPYMST